MPGLTKAEVERYSRQLVLPDLGPEGQIRLKSSSVLIIGAGGLGLPALTYLAASGVGRLGIVDHDIVEVSNLHRQPLFTDADIGRMKAEVAQERLHLANPYISITPYPQALESSNALEIMEEYDVILDCTDNLPARYLINDACVLLHKPDVYASLFRVDGQVTVFDADRGPCYRCLFPTPPPPDTVQDCAVAGVMGVLPGILGSIQAAQAINIIGGLGRSLVGRLLLVDTNDMSFKELKVKKDPSCPMCGPNRRVTHLIDYEEFCGIKRRTGMVVEITPIELKRSLEKGENIVLLDVREPFEHSLCRLEGSKLIPLGELPRRVGELDSNAETVVYCHLGRRSATAVEFLTSMGFLKAKNLKGGITAWAEQVDPSMPTY